MRCCTDRRLLAALLCAATLAGLGGCAKPLAARQPATVSFDWTCDARGRLEPCGCFTGQHGGLTRVSTFLRSPEGAGEHLFVDAGNAIAGPADYQVIQYRYMQRAFAEMGCLALNVGEREAQLPATELKKLRDNAPVPMLSANLVERASGRPIFAPYRIVGEHGYRIAFVGVLGDVPPENLGDGLAVEPMKSAIAKVLPAIRQEADIIVLLAYADEAAMRALADEFYELDVILGGKVKEPSQQLARQNRSLVLWTTNETKALGMLKTTISGRHQLAAQDFNILFVNEQIPQDEKLTELAQNYRDEIRGTALAVDDPKQVGADEVPGVNPSSEYVGSEPCPNCHARAYKIWENCHGPGSEHVAERDRQRVGGGTALFHYRPVRATDCAACHYGEFSRPFDYVSFWQEIRHGKEPASNIRPPARNPPVSLSPVPVPPQM